MQVKRRNGFMKMFVMIAGMTILSCDNTTDVQLSATKQTSHALYEVGSGRDGDVIIDKANFIPNRYAQLTSEINALDNRIILSANEFAALDPKRGDLLMIIQMQGALIDNTNTANYGSLNMVGDWKSAGKYEFIRVGEVDADQGAIVTDPSFSTIKNSYAINSGAQLIWVPQYRTLEVPFGASLTAQPWNGKTGGVLVVQVKSSVVLNGMMNVTGKGFRGGAARVTPSQAPILGSDDFASNNPDVGGEKGEGVAGFRETYRTGMNIGEFGRGAPLNAGGGGGSLRAGGGGGANGNSLAVWTGQGLMSLDDKGGALSWVLDPFYSMTGSSGGGRGGYSFAQPAGPTVNPNLVAPNNIVWGGDLRKVKGGLGGRPVPNSTQSRLFLGGGGGAGDTGGVENPTGAGSGGVGGGLIYLSAAQIHGSGHFIADGTDGKSGDTATNYVGGGGGGGGGTIVVSAELVGNLTLYARGGNGGGHTTTLMDRTIVGPGAGGSGGYITITGTEPSGLIKNVKGGSGGATAAAEMVNFPANGATSGANGSFDTTAYSPTQCAGNPFVIACSADVSVEMQSADANDGQTQLYVTVRNAGPEPARQIKLTLDFSDPFTLVNITKQDWQCQEQHKQYICQLTALEANQKSELTLVLKSAPGYGSSAINASISTASPDLNADNDKAGLAIVKDIPVALMGGGCNLSNPNQGAGGMGLVYILGAIALVIRLKRKFAYRDRL